MNQHQTIKKITLAATVTAIYIVFLFLYKILFLTLDSFLFLLLPIPAAVYSYQHDAAYAFLPLVATTLLSFLFIEILQTIFFVFPGILLGVIYGLLLKRKYSIVVLLSYLFFFEILFSLISDILLADLLGYDFIADTNYFIQQFCQWLKISEHYGSLILWSIIPSYFIIMGIIGSFIVCLGVELILIRFHLKEKNHFSIPACKQKINRIFVWLYLLFFILTVLFAILSVFLSDWPDFFFIFCCNLFILFSLYMIYLGLIQSAISYQKKNQKILYLLIVLSVFVFPFYLIIRGIIVSIKGY